MPSPVLHLDGVTKVYGEVVVTPVLHGLDLKLYPGEFATLVGPSGSGKSTLLNLIGLLDRPTTGRVLVDGLDTARLDDRALTRLRGMKLGFVFQYHHLLPAFTALENVLLPSYSLSRFPSAEQRERACRLLERIGLGARVHHPATHLSGGEQQRVAIARSLINNPRLLLADEPTGNLDTHAADRIFALLRELREESGACLLVVTHDRRLAERSDRIIELVDGKIVSDPAAASPS